MTQYEYRNDLLRPFGHRELGRSGKEAVEGIMCAIRYVGEASECKCFKMMYNKNVKFTLAPAQALPFKYRCIRISALIISSFYIFLTPGIKESLRFE